jgi:TRAP-type C4-dicarboxylate transport system permease small subunit
MLNLFISFITLIGLAFYFFLPSIVAAPYEAIPRIFFYLAYPASVLLACGLFLLGNVVNRMMGKLPVLADEKISSSEAAHSF